MTRFLSIILSLALVFAVLPGCASKYGEQKTTVNYYPSCYRPIHDLRENEHAVAKGTASGAIIGALGGALLGLLSSGGKWEGAVTGAAIGGVTGGVSGNIYAQRQKELDDNRRLAGYLEDLDGDISNVDLSAAAARTSFKCYEQAFNRLKDDIKAKRVTREVAMKRFAEIRSGQEEAAAILGDLVVKTQDLELKYDQALQDEERVISSPQKMAEGRQAYVKKASALKKARTQTKQLAQKSKQLSSEKTSMQDTVNKNTEENSTYIAKYLDKREQRNS